MAGKYCSKCGNQLKVDDKYCVKCGTAQQLLQQKLVVEEYKNVQISSTEAASLNSFREKKPYERITFLKRPKLCCQNRLSKGNSSTPPKCTVLINVGIMKRGNYSILTPVRRKKLPLKVSETSSASEIKRLAIDKQINMHPIIKTVAALWIMFYFTLMENKWLQYQELQLTQETKRGNNSHYVNTKWNKENHTLK